MSGPKQEEVGTQTVRIGELGSSHQGIALDLKVGESASVWSTKEHNNHTDAWWITRTSIDEAKVTKYHLWDS